MPKLSVVSGPDENLVVTVRMPNGKVAAYSLLLLVISPYFPCFDFAGKAVPLAAAGPTPIPVAFKADLIRKHKPAVTALFRDLKSSLKAHNRRYDRLILRHEEYLQPCLTLEPLVKYAQGRFSREGPASCPAVDCDRVGLPRTDAVTLAAWQEAGAVYCPQNEADRHDFRHLVRLIRKAPQVQGEFVLWRQENLASLASVERGHELPFSSFLSASLMLPLATGWSGGTTGCLLKIRVSSQHVPFLALMDNVWREGKSAHQFEVLMPPCFLRVQKLQTVKTSRIMTPAERRISAAFSLNPPPASVKVVTCVALPGRVLYGECLVRLVPRNARVPLRETTSDVPQVVRPPDRNMVLMVRLPHGQVVAYALLTLMLVDTFPWHDYAGRRVVHPVTDIPKGFKIHLIQRYPALVSHLFSELKAALCAHNRNYLKLITRHERHAQQLPAPEVEPVLRMDGDDRGAIDKPLFRRLARLVRRAPQVRGEFVLWRAETRPELQTALPGTRVPCLSFLSTSLLLPFAVGGSHNICCLLKIHVSFDQVPGLAVFDQLAHVRDARHQFRVVLHPCYLHVQECRMVPIEQLLTEFDTRLLPRLCREFPLPTTVYLMTCRAEPGRLVYGKNSVRLKPSKK